MYSDRELFAVHYAEFEEDSIYTLKLFGYLKGSEMLAFLKGANLEIEKPKVLSEQEIIYVQTELLKILPEGKKSREDVKKIEKSDGIFIRIG